MIFDRRTAHRQAIVSPEQAHGLGRLGAGILDGLRLIEHDVIELHVLQSQGVAAQRAVGGQDKVVSIQVFTGCGLNRCNPVREVVG